MTPEEVLKRCDENTIGVVPTLGVTFTCEYEPVKAIADALDKLAEGHGPRHPDPRRRRQRRLPRTLLRP